LFSSFESLTLPNHQYAAQDEETTRKPARTKDL